MALVYLNGEIVDERDAHISVNDRGFVFADGIYEVIRVFDGKPFEMERHLDRLERSAASVRLTLHPTADEIGRIGEDLLAREGAREAQIYIQVTRGTAPRGHAIPAGITPTTLIAIRPASRHRPRSSSTAARRSPSRTIAGRAATSRRSD